MNRYNRVNRVYVAEDRRLIHDVLRKEWGFKGLVISDWMGTYSTAEALNAGLDLEMPGPTKWRGQKLIDAFNDKSVSQDTIDESVRRVLHLARSLGRFERPEEAPEIERQDRERDTFIRDAAADGMVLLKNIEDTLPIPRSASVAVIGQLGKVVSLGGGGSAKVNPLRAETPIQGLEKVVSMLSYAPGVPVFGSLPHADPSLVSPSGKQSAPGLETRPVKLEWFNGSTIGKGLANEEMIPNAEYMIKEAWPTYLDANYCTRMTLDITPETSGMHDFAVITTGIASCYINGVKVFDRPQEPVLKPESFYFFKAKLERRFKHSMTAGQRYTITLESWACNPEILKNPPLNGKMFQGSALRFFEFVDIPKAISAAVETAQSVDYAVVCVGNTNEIESEGYDRDTMDLIGDQYELIRAVAAINPKTIVVNFSGAPVTMTEFIDQVPAIIQAWFPGQECGHSLARILVGDVNPSGRLPMSWPAKNEDNPSHANFPVDEHDVLRYEEGLDIGYRYYDRKEAPKPLFPFGFGLSYTTFEILGATTSAPTISPGARGTIDVECLVKNTGNRAGKFVAQFYVSFPITAIGRKRPLKELKAFSKIVLAAGEVRSVKVELDRTSVSFYDAGETCWRAEEGVYVIQVGSSVVDLGASVSFSVPETFTWTGV